MVKDIFLLMSLMYTLRVLFRDNLYTFADFIPQYSFNVIVNGIFQKNKFYFYCLC